MTHRIAAACFCAFLALAAPVLAQAPAAPAPPPTAPPATLPAPVQTGTPLSLDQAVATALALNEGLQAARLDIDIARDRLLGARAARGPSLDANVVYTRQSRVPTFSTFVPDPDTGGFVLQEFQLGKEDNVDLQGVLSMPLYSGGALTAGVRAAQQGVVAAAAGVERTDQQVAYAVKQAYYGVLLAMNGVTIARQGLAAAEEQLRIAQAFLRAGTAAQFDVTRNEANVAQARQQVTAAENAEAISRAALNNAMGVPQELTFNLTTPLAQQPLATSLPQLNETALAQRPDLRQLQANQEAQRQSIRVARAGRLPQLGLSWTLSAPVSTTTFATGGWTLAVAASMNVFDSGRSRAQIRLAQDTLRQIQAFTEQLRQNVTLEVKQAYLNINTAQEQMVSAQAQLTAADEALRVAQVRYREGVGITVEVIDAQVARQQAANNYSAAVFNYNLAQAQLNLALGQPPTPAAPPLPLPVPPGAAQ